MDLSPDGIEGSRINGISPNKLPDRDPSSEVATCICVYSRDVALSYGIICNSFGVGESIEDAPPSAVLISLQLLSDGVVIGYNEQGVAFLSPGIIKGPQGVDELLSLMSIAEASGHDFFLSLYMRKSGARLWRLWFCLDDPTPTESVN